MSTELRSSGARRFAPEERDHPAADHEPSFAPESPYRLSRNVSLREEPFGALAYHFGNRRLSFLKTPRLVEIVRDLHEHRSVRAALAAHGVPERQRDGYLRALASLARVDMIVRA
ncbi:mycofactocin biosynthesis chaperone MftB [Allosalinactinospora lopnorensis]|uniref:mycofactocin biosynthesis chaperone MftB n=1 Tax=Allosalinactinospora lopnorensis TaxID=1352348 RepID=UPI000A59EC98|nr:mycofactocin biosynthesis chaperone MftB [Allosalinactinospora lopnorensis]